MACCADAGRARYYKQHEGRFDITTTSRYGSLRAASETLAPDKRPLEDPDLTNGSGPGQTRHDAIIAMEALCGGGGSRRPSPSSTVLAVPTELAMHVKGAE